MNELAEVHVDVHGPFALHDFPCPVCRERHAVLDLSRGVMEPCWVCQGIGYQLVRAPRWAHRLVKRWARHR
jgi:hypothetical protein